MPAFREIAEETESAASAGNVFAPPRLKTRGGAVIIQLGAVMRNALT